MSSVTPRLLVLVAWKNDECSHHSPSVGGQWLMSRAPSGRTTDSTWITSAPNMAMVWVRNGPAQNDVKSAMGRPSNGRPGAAVGSMAGGAGGRGSVRIGGPTAGAGAQARGPGMGGWKRNG